MTKLLIVYYSSYGHMFKMAQAAAEAVRDKENYEVRLKKIPELEQARKGMSSQEAYVKAREAQSNIPEATNDDLVWADGIIWGIPTRYGNMPAQIKQFIDTTGSLWAEGKLEGKATGIMSSSNNVHGGQESTILTSLVPLLHLGMIYVGSPYGENQEMFTDRPDKLTGGSPYGPSTIAGADGSLMPVEEDLAMAGKLALRVAKVASKVKELD